MAWRVLVDANLPRSLGDVFRAHGALVLDVRDIGLSAAPDHLILDIAARRGAVLVTRDLEFANPLTYPPGRGHGIFVMRVPSRSTAGEICRVMEAFLGSADIVDLQRAVVIIEPGRYRVRRSRGA